MGIFFILFVALWILVTIFLPIKDMIEARLSKVPGNAVEVQVKSEPEDTIETSKT